MNFPDDFYNVPPVYEALRKAPAGAARRPALTVQVPGSKSITNRAMLLAALAEGTSHLQGALFSDDSRHFLRCLSDLGFPAVADEQAGTITLTGFKGQIPRREAALYVGSAGTAARFLAALLGVVPGCYHLDASPQMRRRPMAPLLSSLQQLGARISHHDREGFFPFTIRGRGFQTKELTVDINQSSQFLSALLIAAVCSEEDITIHTSGSHGMSYIDITRQMMAQFGVTVLSQTAHSHSFLVPGGQTYRAREYRIEPDVSAACYFYAMAPLLGIDVTVTGVHQDSMQGDIQFLYFLEKMGCRLTETPEGILLSGPADGLYRGITADMSACSDQAITMAALAPFAQTPTTITGIGHIRFQESDRIAAMAGELKRMGLRCEETKDSLTIWPGTPKPAAIHTYEDHRMAMGFSLTGLRAEGISILDPGCCRKTFENYFQVLTDAIHTLTNF